MMRMLRTLRATRLAVFAVLAGVLVQAALGLPLSLRMADADTPICSLAHAAGGADAPGLPSHDHQHCLICQASAAPPLTAEMPPLPPRRAVLQVATVHFAPWAILTRPPSGFSSRAPPALG